MFRKGKLVPLSIPPSLFLPLICEDKFIPKVAMLTRVTKQHRLLGAA